MARCVRVPPRSSTAALRRPALVGSMRRAKQRWAVPERPPPPRSRRQNVARLLKLSVDPADVIRIDASSAAWPEVVMTMSESDEDDVAGDGDEEASGVPIMPAK